MGNITYIDRSDFDRTMQERYCFNCERKGNYPIFGVACKTCWVMNMLEEIELFPAADVVEVRHARWIKDDETGEPICSACRSGKPTKCTCSPVIEHKLNNYEIRYCYYCGAKMDGGESDAVD